MHPGALRDSDCSGTTETTTHTHWAASNLTGIAPRASRARAIPSGSLAGGMMTNIMCWAYADIFTADATFSGFISAPHRGGQRNLGPADPYCASGRVMHTAEEWLDILRHASSDHTKPDWGKQLWLCGANHVELNAKFGERLKRWSVIRKVPFTRNATSVFALGERQTIYGNGTKVISRAQQGGQHITPSDDDYLHRLFGSIGGLITMSSNSTSADSGTNTTDTTAGAGSSTTTTTTGTNETPKEGCIVSNWGQCEGQSVISAVWTSGFVLLMGQN